MASTRALLPFAVVVAFTACSIHSMGVEAQNAPVDTVIVTIMFDQHQLELVREEGRPPVAVIDTDPDPVHASPGDVVVFRFPEEPTTVQFSQLSPFDRIAIPRPPTGEASVRVRGDAMHGVYKSIIAVYSEDAGTVYITDPHFII